MLAVEVVYWRVRPSSILEGLLDDDVIEEEGEECDNLDTETHTLRHKHAT